MCDTAFLYYIQKPYFICHNIDDQVRHKLARPVTSMGVHFSQKRTTYMFATNTLIVNVLICMSRDARKPVIGVSSQVSVTQTGLYSLRSRLEVRNFGSQKKRNCTIRVAKTKALNMRLCFRICKNPVFSRRCSYVRN